MALSFLAASGGQDAATEDTTVITTLPTGTAAGDITLYLSVVGSSATWQALANWTIEAQATNPNGTIHSAAVYSRIWSGTPAAPTFTSSVAGKNAWVGITFRPGAGETPSLHAIATTLISTAGTTATPNPTTSSDASAISLVFNSNRAQANGATGITQTPASTPNVYTEPTNGDQSTAVGTTNALRQVGAHLAYRTGIGTGTIQPGAFTFNVSVIDIAFHLVIRSAGAATRRRTPTPRRFPHYRR
jgi:hypothetical protein